MRGEISKLSLTLFVILVLFLVSDKTFAQTDSIKSKKNNFSIYPVLGYAPETNFAFGLISFLVYDNAAHQENTFYRPSSISPYFLYTLNNQMLLAIDFDMYFKNGYYLDIKPRYYKYPDRFYGVGNDSKKENEEIYTNEFQRVDGRFMKFINQQWLAGLRFDFQHNDIYDLDDEGQLISGNFKGIEGGFIAGIGPSIQFDSRNNILYPSSGVLALAEITLYSKAFGGDYHFTNYIIDLRKYIWLKNEKNILAFQAAGNFTTGSDIPFYKLQKVGGDSRLRGIENSNLYIDKQSFWMQAEYRRELFWRFGGVAFAGFGDVAPSLDKFRFNELKYVVGLGGRFQAMKDEKLNVRLDAGIGRGGQYAFYLSVKEAF